MGNVSAKVNNRIGSRILPLSVALTTSLMASACAQLGGKSTPALLASASKTNPAQPDNRSELHKATEYWGEAFAKAPNDPKTALAYAKNLKAMGRKQEALKVLQHSLSTNSDKPEIASEYGRLALEAGNLAAAEQALKYADVPGKADWKTVSARGALLARRGKFRQAIPEFERALALSNENPSVLNNLGMAYVLSGEPAKAEGFLRRALAGDANNAKVQKNLALALGLQGRYEESKRIGAMAQNAATANSDTEALRKLVRLPQKAVPAPAPTYAEAKPDAYRPPAKKVALKPATHSDPAAKWDKLVAMAKSSQNNSPSVDLRGSTK
ncbi:MAG: tetratricopeptide repeat protein [Hyphomicrobiaceae bacterium]